MKQWQQLPPQYQLNDDRIKEMSFGCIQCTFASAQKELSEDDFNDFVTLFWNAVERFNATKASLQECVYLLEEQKRHVGRTYAKACHDRHTKLIRPYWASKYNELEYQIQWLVGQYGLRRKTKEYFLTVEPY